MMPARLAMAWGIAFIIGAVIGVGAGFATERVDVHPAVRSAASATISLLLGMLGMLVVWYSRPGRFNSGYLAIGLDNLLWLLAFLGAVLALHVALGFVPEPVRNHRPFILGAVGGVCGAVSVAWLMAVAARLSEHGSEACRAEATAVVAQAGAATLADSRRRPSGVAGRTDAEVTRRVSRTTRGSRV